VADATGRLHDPSWQRTNCWGPVPAQLPRAYARVGPVLATPAPRSQPVREAVAGPRGLASAPSAHVAPRSQPPPRESRLPQQVAP